MSEEIQKLFERVAKACVAAVNCLKTAFEALCKIITQICKAVSELWICIVKNYPNRRVVQLALYHHRAKVRKKNMRRILRWLRMEVIK